MIHASLTGCLFSLAQLKLSKPPIFKCAIHIHKFIPIIA